MIRGLIVSAIWSKYLDLQGGDVETQRQILAKDKEIFQKEKEISTLNNQVSELKNKSYSSKASSEFEVYVKSGKIEDFIAQQDNLLSKVWFDHKGFAGFANAMAFGLVEYQSAGAKLSEKGKAFFKWLILR